uniref:NADH-ubiquinone oxidoreductase chain 4L n=1 Tax=Mutinus fleischeri TaxID=2218478 RepID=A0A8K1VCE9_9AGAM|nr:NADH dehydrogenase subunit 4L [Mutinus fleischeri]
MNLSLFLFLIGILGFILNRKNLLLLIISIEIMLLAVTLLIIMSSFNFDDNIGQTFAIYIITIAGAESVIGLSILVAYYRLKLLLINIHSYIKKNLENFWLDSKILNLDYSNHNDLKDFKLDNLTLIAKGKKQYSSSIPPVYYFSKSLLSLLCINKQNLHNFRNYSSWSFMSKIER